MNSKFYPEKHLKGWGNEIWIHNSDLYCGKILNFESGKKCSWHYHLVKDEVFYVQSGRIELYYSLNDDVEAANKIFLLKGESFHVPAGMRHQMRAIETTELFEISTQHLEEDTYRIVKGD
jgi:hypothetical protein